MFGNLCFEVVSNRLLGLRRLKMMISRFGRSVLGQLLVIGVLCFTAYSFMLSGPFSVMDDQVSIVDNSNIKSFSNLGKVFSSSFFGGHAYYRPLVSVTYMLEYHFFNLYPFFYKLTNLILHFLCACCVYFFIKTIFPKGFVSFFVSLLFAIHPIHWEQVSHVAGRSILLCAFFYLGAFLLYCLSLSGKQKVLYALALLAYLLSFFSKESAVTLPVLLLCYENFIKREEGKENFLIHLSVRQIRSVLPFFGLALFFIGLRRYLGITNIPLWTSFHDLLLGHLTFLRGFLTYLRLFVFPVDLHFDRSIAYFGSFHNAELILTILFYAFSMVVLLRLRRKVSLRVAFFLCWTFFTILPVAQLVPLPSRNGYASLAEHFLYIPSVGIFVLLVLGFLKLMEVAKRMRISSKVVWFAVIGFYLFFFITTIQQNIYSSEELSMFKYSLEHNPENLRVRNSYALALALRGLYSAAENQYRIALSIEPGNVNSRISLGKSLCDQGKIWEGIQEYEKLSSWDIGKYRKLLNNNLHLAYQALIRRYLDKIEKDPDNPECYFQLGVLYSKANRIEEGIEAYQKALILKPLYRDALYNLTWSYEVLGEYQQAAFYCEEMLKLDYFDPKEKEKVYGRLIGLQKTIIEQQNESNP